MMLNNRSLTANIENWKFKRRSELEALSDAELNDVATELSTAFKLFFDAGIPRPDEMVWLLMVLPNVIEERKIKKQNEIQNNKA